MKSRVLLLITFLYMLGTSLLSQVSFYAIANLDTNSNSVELDQVFVSRYLSAMTLDEHFLVAGVINDQTYYQGDSVPAVFIIDPSGSIQPSYSKAINFSQLGYKKLTPLDAIELPNQEFAICGKIWYESKPVNVTSGFLLKLNSDLNPTSITIYDNMITANALTYADNNEIFIVGQSYQDTFQGNIYDSLPCVMLVDSDTPVICLQGYSVHNGSPNIDHGSFNDIEYLGGDHYALTGQFRSMDNALPYQQEYLHYDLLLSCIHYQPGQIASSEDVIIQSVDMRDEIGRRLLSNGTNELFVTGESYDPYFQMYGKRIFALRINGNISPANLLNNLSYDFRDVGDIGNGTNNIYVNGLDYHNPYYRVLTISGYYLNDLGNHPYILQTEDFFTPGANYHGVNDFYGINPQADKCFLQRNHILHTTERVLAFGWELDDTGFNRLLIVGDTLLVPNSSCSQNQNVQAQPTEINIIALDSVNHKESISQYTPIHIELIMEIAPVCNQPVFSAVTVEPEHKQAEISETLQHGISLFGEKIRIPETLTGSYQVHNMMGQMVMSGSLSSTREISISSLPAGFYVLLLEKQAFVYKFVR